jgi:nucleoside-diphosphate-sugar epimerase
MKLLVIGGAGYVGSIIRPDLDAAHACRHLDLKPVPGAEDRTLVGDVNNDAVVQEAVRDQEAVLYLAMGMTDGIRKTVNDVDPAFNVNVRGLYRVLHHALSAGVRRFVYTSTLSVYDRVWSDFKDENAPPNAWQPYGISKRLGESLCQAAAQQFPLATILALRLCLPQNEADWPAHRYDPTKARNHCDTGPQDIRRLFLRALELDHPGCHIVQATGDMSNQRLPNTRVQALLGWSPENR